MNLKELIFGGVHDAGGSDGVYRDSIQSWLPIKNIIGGVVITKDNRFVKILEVLPVNIYLKSPADRQNIITSFASYLKIAPDSMQFEARTLPADTADYVRQMEEYADKEENEYCREMIRDNIHEIGEGIASEALRHRLRRKCWVRCDSQKHDGYDAFHRETSVAEMLPPEMVMR